VTGSIDKTQGGPEARMTMEQIKHIMDTLIVRHDADLVHEVRGLLDIFDDAVYREKIRSAI
jgi:hypothetical protein